MPYGQEDIYGEGVDQESKKNDKKKRQVELALEENKEALFEMDEGVEGDQFMASKPWEGAIKEPTQFKKPQRNQDQAPKIDLELEFVHGYRSRDCKNNIRYLKDGSICYHAAALGIVLDKKTHTQRFFNQHTDDITAIAFHPEGLKIATGELGKKPAIHIWDTSTCSSLHKLQGSLTNGVKSLAFSPNGDLLCGVGMDTYHMIALWDVNRGSLIALEKGDAALILQVCFQNDSSLISVGVKHFKFWKFQNRIFHSKKGIFKRNDNRLCCVAADADLVLTGAGNGDLYSWKANTIVKVKKLHSRPLDAIAIEKQM